MSRSIKDSDKQYYLLLLITSFFWASSFIVSKGLVEHASPMTLTILRWIVVVICLLPIVWWKEKRLIPEAAAIIPLLFMALTGVILFNVFQFLALERTTASNVGIISTLNVMSIALFSMLFLREKMTLLQGLAMFGAFCGVILVVLKGDVSQISAMHFNQGDLWMVAAVMIWGIYTVCTKWAMNYVSPLMATLYSGVFGIVMLLPFSWSQFTISNVDSQFILGLAYISIVATVISMLLWNIGVQRLGAMTAGLFLNFNPIFTAILAYLLLDERFNSMQLIGCIAVIVGSVAFSVLKNKGR